MAEKAVTVNTTTASAVFDTTLGQVGQYQYVRVINSGANAIWFNDFNSAVVTAGAVECTYLAAGQYIMIPYVVSISALSLVGASSITIRGIASPHTTKF